MLTESWYSESCTIGEQVSGLKRLAESLAENASFPEDDEAYDVAEHARTVVRAWVEAESRLPGWWQNSDERLLVLWTRFLLKNREDAPGVKEL